MNLVASLIKPSKSEIAKSSTTQDVDPVTQKTVPPSATEESKTAELTTEISMMQTKSVPLLSSQYAQLTEAPNTQQQPMMAMSDASVLPGKSVLQQRVKARKAILNAQSMNDRRTLQVKVTILTLALVKFSLFGILAVHSMTIRTGALGQFRQWASHSLHKSNVTTDVHDEVVDKLLLTHGQHTLAATASVYAGLALVIQLGTTLFTLAKDVPLPTLVTSIGLSDTNMLFVSLVIGTQFWSELGTVDGYETGLSELIDSAVHPAFNQSFQSTSADAPINRLVAGLLFTVNAAIVRNGTVVVSKETRAHNIETAFVKLHRMFECCGLLNANDWMSDEPLTLSDGMHAELTNVGIDLTKVASFSRTWFCECYKREGWPCLVPWHCCQARYRGSCLDAKLDERVRRQPSTCNEKTIDPKGKVVKKYGDRCSCARCGDCYKMNKHPNVTDDEILSAADDYCGLDDNEHLVSQRRRRRTDAQSNRFDVTLSNGVRKKLDKHGKYVEAHHTLGCVPAYLATLRSTMSAMTILFMLVVPLFMLADAIIALVLGIFIIMDSRPKATQMTKTSVMDEVAAPTTT